MMPDIDPFNLARAETSQASTEPETVTALGARYRSVLRAYEASDRDDDAFTATFNEETSELTDRITDTPATDIAGLLMKAEIARAEVTEHNWPHDPHDQPGLLIISLLNDLDRLLGNALTGSDSLSAIPNYTIFINRLGTPSRQYLWRYFGANTRAVPGVVCGDLIEPPADALCRCRSGIRSRNFV